MVPGETRTGKIFESMLVTALQKNDDRIRVLGDISVMEVNDDAHYYQMFVL